MPSPDRIIVVSAPCVGQADAVLHVFSLDGGTAAIALCVGTRILARGYDFRRPEVGRWTWLDAPEGEVAGTFGGFLSHALESSEGDARDGWPILEDDAAEWCDTLALMEEDERAVDRCEACGSDRGDGYCQECPDDPSRAYDARQ